jgi:hypothetical protein
MRRSKAFKRGRWLSILLAGLVGFLLGDWHATSSRPSGLSSVQNVATPFPDPKADAVVADAAADMPTSAIAAGSMVPGDADLALFSPDPMVPSARHPVAPSWPPAIVPAAAPEEPAPAPKAGVTPQAVPSATQRRTELKATPEGASRHANRPGFLLNDAQIASIKTRLHLTPDQERMWPAVEAARGTSARRARGRRGRLARSRERGGARAEVRGGPADHELFHRAEERGAQPRPRHGIG